MKTLILAVTLSLVGCTQLARIADDLNTPTIDPVSGEETPSPVEAATGVLVDTAVANAPELLDGEWTNTDTSVVGLGIGSALVAGYLAYRKKQKAKLQG